MVKPGALRKGAFWQNLAGDCSDLSIQTQAKQNLVRGLVSVFGWDMGLQATDVKIACGKTGKQKRSVLSNR